MRKLLLVGSMMASAAAPACGGDDGGNGGDSGTPTGTCYDYSKFDGATPATAFKADVLPVLQSSCTVSASCHNDPGSSAGRTYLGPSIGTEPTDDDLAAFQTQNINAASFADSGLKRIVPSKPADSFLMHKIDGDFECAVLACSKSECGGRMPLGNPSGLPTAQADVIRRWIAQGAEIN